MTNLPKLFNLNSHTHYSCGMAIGTSKEIIEKAKEVGLSGIAITDRNTISGALDFYKTGKELKFPITIGLETFFIDNENNKVRIVLLAKNQNGYLNLCKISSNSWDNEATHKEPCISQFHLFEFKDDVFCLCDNSDYNNQLREIYGDSLLNEIILSESNIVKNQKILSSNSRFVITLDNYIPGKEYKGCQDIMLENGAYSEIKNSFQEIKPIIGFQDLLEKWKQHAYYFKAEKFLEGIKNSNMVGEECSKISLKFKDQVINFPHIMHPLNTESLSKEDLVWKIAKQYGRLPEDPIYIERFKYEMDSICNNSRVNLIDYFLVLEDLCRACRENNVMVGPGRGSGAGSLVNYCLRITNLDPIKNNLLFERFISKGRIEAGTLPDVDLDFSNQKWARDYLIEKYGSDRVMRIGTFQTLKTLGSIKDVTKALYPELDFVTVNNVTKTFGKKEQDESEKEFYERNKEENETLKNFFIKYPNIEKEVDRLLGYNRQTGSHPCGLAITQDPIVDFAPTRITKEERILDFSAGDCEKSGIIKYDILALNTLKCIQTCCELIGLTDIYSIPIDDKATFEAFSLGDTASVFQFNSDVAINILTRLPVSKISVDVLSMVTSVGRPGPMGNGQHEEFIKRVNGIHKPTPPHFALEQELRDTYGIMIYQEGVMKASQILGGLTPTESDDVRKAMGKKKASILKPFKEVFIKNCQQKYLDTKSIHAGNTTIAEHIWDLMATFSGYGFNKSHSMSYALIGYYCQYLKVHHPLEWWCSCFTHADADQLKEYYHAAKNHCIHPDINDSTQDFRIVDGKVYFPLSSIKRLGPKATEEIYKNRPYTSFNDFLNKINKSKVNKTVVTQLIFAGCFDKLHPGAYQLLVDKYFSFRGEAVPEEILNLSISKVKELRQKALSFLDIDLFDMYGERFTDLLRYDDMKLEKKKMNTLGRLDKIKKRETKKKEVFANLVFSNCGETLDCKLWPQEYETYKKHLKEGKDFKLTGVISYWNDQKQFTITNLEEL